MNLNKKLLIGVVIFFTLSNLSFGQSVKIIKDVIYENGKSKSSVKAKIYKKSLISDEWEPENGRTFLKQRLDSCDCSKYYQIKVVPEFSGIYSSSVYDCADLPEILKLESTRTMLANRQIDWGSNFAGDTIINELITFEKDISIDSAIMKILVPIGLEKLYLEGTMNIEAASVQNAQASIINGKPYIFYNPSIIPQIMNDDWGIIGIFSHEIGHIAEYHNINISNIDSLEKADNHKIELSADEFAGFVLRYLNASKEDALEMIRYINYEDELFTHPSKDLRIKQIIIGWNKADDVIKNVRIDKKYLIYQKLAEESIVDNELDKALSYLDTAITYNDQSDKLFAERASIRNKLNYDPKLIFSDANKAISFNKNNLKALNMRAWAYLRNFNIIEAEKDINNIKELDASSSYTLFLLGYLNELKKNYNDALKLYDSAIITDSTLYVAYQQRGLIYEFLNMKDLALNDYNYLIEKNPSNSYGYRLASSIYYSRQQFDTTITILSAAINIDSIYWDYYHWRGVCYIEVGKELINKSDTTNIDNAISDFKKAISLNYQALDSRSNLARLYTLKGDYDMAIIQYDKLIELNPIQINFYERALVYFRKGLFQFSYNDFQSLLERNPNDLQAKEGRAFCNLNLKKYDEAISDFSNIIKNSTSFKNAYLGLAFSHYFLGDYNSVLDILFPMIQNKYILDSTNVYYSFLPYTKNSEALLFFYYGKSHLELKNYDNALMAFELALIQDSGFSKIYYNIALCYLHKKKKKKACKYLQYALNNGFDKMEIDNILLEECYK